MGLLPLLKSIHKSVNLKSFEGKTLGVDAYGWLHRGTVACAMDLAMDKPTSKFVDFAMHRVRMLQHFGVTPFLIFDGDYLPSKAATETDRAKRREQSRKSGFDLLNAGKASQAYLEFQKAVDVTPEMARQLIDELRRTGVQYIVAPYEADAQMVYLERKGVLDGIISEDSDLLVFGAKCLLTKLDQYGNCIEVNRADFCACREINLTGWTDAEFRRMAILSGCDYLSSITNMGLKTAYRMVRKYRTLEKVVKMLQFDGKFSVPVGYLEAFQQAERTFLYQRVFCPQAESLVLHTVPEETLDVANMPYIGAFVEPEIARGVARGDLNPMTKLPIVSQPKALSRAPHTPWNASRPKHVRTSSDNLKKGVPIEHFFKPKRIPLAELQINCFTPSPSQQQALRRNTGPWLSDPVSRQYLNRSITEPNLSSPTVLPPSRQQDRIERSRTTTEPRPMKRARLCDDNDTPVLPGTGAELGPSRFFSSNVPDPSPSIRRVNKGKRSKQQDINIYSDDSIEEAMLNLPDVGGCASVSSKKVQVFSENQVARNTEETGSSDEARVEDAESQTSVPSLTASTSTIGSQEQPPTPVDEHSPVSIMQLKSKYTFGSTSTPKPPANIPPTPPSSTSTKLSKIPLAVKKTTTISQASTSKSNLTPLQRLGASAINRFKAPMTPPETPTYPVGRNTLRRSMLRKTSLPFPDVARGLSTLKSIEPADVPLPIPDETENLALILATGSEDLIIRDSEGEDESLSPQAPRLDLGRFAFVG